jgi:hypothetical protein
MTMDDSLGPFHVSLTHLFIDREVKRSFDTLADYFSCTQRDLQSSTLEQLERRMHIALAKNWNYAEFARVQAHCKSFAEILVLYRVCEKLRKEKGCYPAE